MSNDESRPLIERIIQIETLDPFPNKSRDKVTVKTFGEENGQVHYEFTVTRRGTISRAEMQS